MMKALLRCHDGALGPLAAILALPFALLITLALDHADLSPQKSALRDAIDKATAVAVMSGAGSPDTLALLIRRSLDADLGRDLSQRLTVEDIKPDGKGGLRVRFSAILPSRLARIFQGGPVRLRLYSHISQQMPQLAEL